MGKRYRHKGIGKSMLMDCIARTKKEHKPILRLYTSTRPNEAAAHKLYTKLGFQTFGRKPEKNSKYHTVYKELILSRSGKIGKK